MFFPIWSNPDHTLAQVVCLNEWSMIGIRMNRILMFFRVSKCFLSVDSYFSRKIINMFVELLVELDWVFKISEKKQESFYLLTITCLSI